MSKPSPRRDGITAVVPVHDAADRLDKLIPAWAAALDKLDRPYEILVVDDGSTDTTPTVLEKLAARVPHLRVLKHEARRGFGASLKTALAEAAQPLFFYTSLDYPYTPGDLKRFVERIEVRDEFLNRQPDLISGARTGQSAPVVGRALGRAWRILARVAAGMQLQPRATWLGFGDYAYNKFVGTVFGVPLGDVNSAFKLYRTAFLKRVPIQSDGDFVHTELVAKATFLTSIMDEIPLTPKPDPAPPLSPMRAEMWRVFKHPSFVAPAPVEPAPVPVPEPSPAVGGP
ncbi:MAG TPA: glycosyltransferase family 2 protein [Gemmataceae bacterium]|nr:glycosyltransferase family 2 protein [Gemmataceae bacterium]